MAAARSGPLIAALPMYDRPQTRAANDRLWALTRAALGRGPRDLTRGRDVWDIWQSPDLLLAQSCGFPFRARLQGRVTLVGTPDYRLEDCPAGHYFSVFVTRAADAMQPLRHFAHRRFAYNSPLSQSGWAAAQTHAATLGFRFQCPIRTGSHRASARAVAEGRADCAALDAVSWEMMRRWDDFAAPLAVVARTPPTPGLPLISAKGADAGALFDAVQQAIGRLAAPDRATLLLRGLSRIATQCYLEVPTPPPPPPAAQNSPLS